MTEIVLVCDDFFGMDVLSVIEEINKLEQEKTGEARYRIKGYISNRQAPLGETVGQPERLGSISGWIPAEDERVVIGLSRPEQKMETVRILKEKGAKFETICAPWIIAYPMEVGEGSIVAAYSANYRMKIGSFVTIIGSMLSCRIVGDYSTILRYANIVGDPIGSRTYIGNHVFVAREKSVGDDCRLEDGAVIVKSVKSGTCVSGVPAKKRKETARI